MAAIALSLSFAPLAAAQTQPTLPKVLRIGTSGDYAPFSVEHGGAYAGFDVDVAERFARETGFEIEWVTFRWPELGADVAGDRFDVAMSGITFTPERATVGYLTRAVATSGPCLLGDATPKRIAVNRGGALEQFARRQYANAEIRAVDRNLSLPDLLARGEVDAIVTDRFEVKHMKRGDWPEHCEAPVDRKVYWVSPARAGDLGPRLDAWLAHNETQVDALRARWLGGAARRTEADHLVDLVARRLALMPAVARAKAARGLPIEDPEREAKVIAGARARSRAAGLDAASVEAFFRLQIDLGKRVQERDAKARAEAPDLALETALRPAIGALGDRIVSVLAESAPLPVASVDGADWAPVAVWLDASERATLRDAMLAVRR